MGERRIRACFPEKEFGRETILHARSIESLERTPANVNSCKKLAAVPAAACQYSAAKVGNSTCRIILSSSGGSNSPFGPPIAMRCWTGVVRSLGMGGRLMSASQCGSGHQNWQPLGQNQKRSHDKSNKESSRSNTGQISSLDHNQVRQRNARYLSPTNRPEMANKCTPRVVEVGRTMKSIIPTCICNPVQVGRPAYPKSLQPWCY
jgi:hypothetical protein